MRLAAMSLLTDNPSILKTDVVRFSEDLVSNVRVALSSHMTVACCLLL